MIRILTRCIRTKDTFWRDSLNLPNFGDWKVITRCGCGLVIVMMTLVSFMSHEDQCRAVDSLFIYQYNDEMSYKIPSVVIQPILSELILYHLFPGLVYYNLVVHRWQRFVETIPSNQPVCLLNTFSLKFAYIPFVHQTSYSGIDIWCVLIHSYVKSVST